MQKKQSQHRIYRQSSIKINMDAISIFYDYLLCISWQLQISIVQNNMGNSPNNPLNKCQSQANMQRFKSLGSHYHSCSFNSYKADFASQNTHHRLSHFRGQLSTDECLYVLNTLLQQYYTLFKQYDKVVVSDHLCQVTNLGEVKVDFCIDGPETPLNIYNQLTHSFVTVVSQILQLFCSLNISKARFQSSEHALFLQRLTKIIYRFFSNYDRMYSQLLQEINFFMQKQNIKCNLLAAVIRASNPKERKISEKIVSQSSIYDKPPLIAHSYSHITLKTQNPYKSQLHRVKFEENSNAFKIKDSSTKIDSYEDRRVSEYRQTKFPVYKHKVVRTEGQDYYQNINKQHIRNQASYLTEMPPTQRHQAKEYQITQYSKQSSHSHRYKHISAQYSVQILNISNSQKNSKVPQKVKFKKQEQSQSIIEYKDSPDHKKDAKHKQRQSSQHTMQKKTSIQQFYQKGFTTQKHSRMHTKSMLDDLARSVQVREQPSSRSYIF